MVIAIPKVQTYLHDLAQILYEKEYFGLEDFARKYVIELFDEWKRKGRY